MAFRVVCAVCARKNNKKLKVVVPCAAHIDHTHSTNGRSSPFVSLLPDIALTMRVFEFSCGAHGARVRGFAQEKMKKFSAIRRPRSPVETNGEEEKEK